MGRRLMVTAGSGKLPVAQSVNFERVYHELRAIARRFFEGEREGHTLTPTSLVHEAWMRVEKTSELSEADGQRQVRAIVATVMRQILVEHARRRRRRIQILKSGTDPIFRMAAEEAVQGTGNGSFDLIDLLDLDLALLRLSEEFPNNARLVELKFFGGLTLAECASEMGICERTADRYWRFARAWLNEALETGRA
jgi:RNA polymerase sigma factor (TIGR02999 family)